MPDIVMHHHFGKVVYSGLSDEIKEKINNIPLYDFATSGPDAFFTCNFLNKTKQQENQEFGNYMHAYRTKEFLVKLAELSRVDYNMFNYLCGYVTHYYLDTRVHPYIFHFTGVYDPQDPTTFEYRGFHTKLERAMDSYVIENYYDSVPHRFKIYHKILKLKKIQKSSKESFDQLYSIVYGRNEGFKLVNNSIKWQRRFYRFIYDRFGWKQKILEKKDDGESKIDLSMLSYYGKKIDSNEIDIFNFHHKEWCHPVDNSKISNATFFDLFDTAKVECANCIQALYHYVFDNENIDFDLYFKDVSYITNLPCSYDLEMKYFDNIFKKTPKSIVNEMDS